MLETAKKQALLSDNSLMSFERVNSNDQRNISFLSIHDVIKVLRSQTQIAEVYFSRATQFCFFFFKPSPVNRPQTRSEVSCFQLLN